MSLPRYIAVDPICHVTVRRPASNEARQSIYMRRSEPSAATRTLFDKYRNLEQKRGGGWSEELEMVERIITGNEERSLTYR